MKDAIGPCSIVYPLVLGCVRWGHTARRCSSELQIEHFITNPSLPLGFLRRPKFPFPLVPIFLPLPPFPMTPVKFATKVLLPLPPFLPLRREKRRTRRLGFWLNLRHSRRACAYCQYICCSCSFSGRARNGFGIGSSQLSELVSLSVALSKSTLG